MSIRVLGDLELSGVLRWKKNLSDFPLNPEPYTLITKDGIPYFYTELVNNSGFFSWQPIGIKQASYLHVQGVASSLWTVTHNFNTTDFAYFIYDSNHNLMIADIAIVDLNTIKIELSEAMTGTVVLFSMQYLNSTTVSATQQLNLGSAVLTSNAGVLEINNNPVAFTQYVDAQDAVLGARIDNLVSNADPSAIDSLSEIVAAFSNADGDLSAAISSMSTSAASALADESTRAQIAENSLQSALDIVNSVLVTKADSAIVDAQISALEAQILSNIQVSNSSLSNSIPTAVSQLINDANYQTASNVSASIAAGISGKANASSLATVATSGSYLDLINKPTIPVVPVNVSAFINDAGYQTSAQVASAIVSASASATGSSSNNFAVNTLTVSGNIMPAVSGVSNIGSPTDKFDAIYTKELHLDANTLYLNGVPVLGSTAATMNFTADVNQGITILTSGTGETVLNSQAATIIQTNGQNADVVVQSGGQGSMTRISSSTQVVLTAPVVNIQGDQSISGALTVAGNFSVNGTTTFVNTANMSIKDNIITVNKGEAGSGVSLRYAGIDVDRGDLARQRLVWDETVGKWVAGQTNQEVALATEPFVTAAIASSTSSVSKSSLGLSNVDNTSDANKPVSTATVAAISAETSRAVSVESALRSDLNAEITRAEAAEALFSQQANTYTKSEVDAAIAAAITKALSDFAATLYD